MSDAKTLCKWSKEDNKKRHQKLVKIVQTPHYLCGKCARAACKEKWLCRPRALAMKQSC